MLQFSLKYNRISIHIYITYIFCILFFDKILQANICLYYHNIEDSRCSLTNHCSKRIMRIFKVGRLFILVDSKRWIFGSEYVRAKRYRPYVMRLRNFHPKNRTDVSFMIAGSI